MAAANRGVFRPRCGKSGWNRYDTTKFIHNEKCLMDKIEQFYDVIRKEMAVTLATSAEGFVTMRLVSPVLHQGGILIFTSPNSKKYRQLQANPRCGIAAGPFFAEAFAKFCGAAMLSGNAELRDAYCQKFPHAFEEGVEFGGRNADFLLLSPTRISGWAYENDIPTENGIPTIPFDIELKTDG